MRRSEHNLRIRTSNQWRRKTETVVMVGGRNKGVNRSMWQGKFLPDGREGRTFGWWSKENLRSLGGNLWEFSSDVLNFPREVGGEVVFGKWKGRGCSGPGELKVGRKSAGVNSMTREGCSEVINRVTARHRAWTPRSPFSVYPALEPFGSIADTEPSPSERFNERMGNS